VRIFDAGEHGGRPYFVMEHVEGETLAQLVAREGRLRPERAVALAVQAARGLEAAHGAGLVHRDVKPHNLLLGADGVLKVTDFGIARAQEGTQLTAAGTVLGTAGYVAPEQLAGGPVTVASDVYGLGAVVYELLTGRPPRSATTLAGLGAEPIRPPGTLAPGIPPALEAVVLRCLADEPADRPQSAGELAAELAAAVDAPTRVDPDAPTRRGARAAALPRTGGPPRPQPRRAAPARLLAAVAVLLVALGIGLALALRGGDGASPPAQAPPQVTPVPHSEDAAQQARNLSAWLRRWSGGGG
jgi:serine/threonine-protein kinase